MAMPPEPIDELLPKAEFGVIAEVLEIKERGEQAYIPKPEQPDTVDIPRDLPYQVVTLQVKERLFGQAQAERFDVYKPAGDYVLRAGIEGPFFLCKDEDHKQPVILGRYGPDNYTLHVVRAAIKKHGRS
ncbi:MAG: hypothetical protein H6728_15360 [Myxococcales bacterium]|nr:hypothetical protein [Myxococcales bacterium]MCB9644449.1 hypothetical protein [Myxococcales bacterium]